MMHAYNMSNVNLALREKFIFTGNITKQLMYALSSFSNTEVNTGNCFKSSMYQKSSDNKPEIRNFKISA